MRSIVLVVALSSVCPVSAEDGLILQAAFETGNSCEWSFTVPAIVEQCDGVDNDCDGRIDGSTICSPCPFGMVLLTGIPTIPSGLCIDSYEASRPDATASDGGSSELYATSRPGVLPWLGTTVEQAHEACRGSAANAILPGAVAQRRLCAGGELASACDDDNGGYPYGEFFMAGACNDSSSGTAVEPTASYQDCCRQVGPEGSDRVCDLSGNAAEVVMSPFSGVFGGSAETSDSALLACDTDSTGSASAGYHGFRCCVPPMLEP